MTSSPRTRFRALARDSRVASGIHDVVSLAYWRMFASRESDVFLCSYPKSGRTWLRFLLCSYQIELQGLDFHLTLDNFYQLSPNLTLFSEFKLTEGKNAESIVRTVGTHSELPILFNRYPVIFLRRDLRDVLVSYYYHRLARGEIKEGIDTFVWSPWGLPHAVRYCNSWMRALAGLPHDSVLEISYERMHVATAECLGECLGFMGVQVDPDLIDRAVSYSHVSNMKALERDFGTPDFDVEELQRNDTAFQVRKARVGGFLEEFSAETLARVSDYLNRNLFDTRGYEY